MEQLSFAETAKELTRQLESTLARLAIAGESNLSTYYLEDDAKKLAGKLKQMATFANIPVYKDIKGNELWQAEKELPDSIFYRYAKLCKQFNDAVKVRKQDGIYYAKVTEGLFINLVDLPEIPIPEFKVKLEGDTLMAVRVDLLEKLPKDTRKLLDNKGESDE
jgi:hypothetical protein